jgi:magnesium transporter
MIRSLYRAPDGRLDTDLPPEAFSTALQTPGGLLWVDLEGEPPEVCEPILRDVFGFHPLAIDDALQETHVPKVDDWGEYLCIVLHAVTFEDGGQAALDTLELDAFLGKNYVVTHQARSIAAVDRVWSACQRDERRLQRGAAHLLYELADELVADYMPAVERFDEIIDQIEDQVFTSPGSGTLQQMFGLKRALLHLRRIITPQREVLNKLARGDFEVIEARDRVYFRDVYDHLVRLYDLVESLRDLLGGALETYLSVINNRMNEVVKTLTLITTLFMPLSFVAGFFGMNFFQAAAPLDIWTGKTAFVLTLVILLLTPVGMYLWMRRRAWM